MICDRTSSLETNFGPIFNIEKCDVENWSLQHKYTENGLNWWRRRVIKLYKMTQWWRRSRCQQLASSHNQPFNLIMKVKFQFLWFCNSFLFPYLKFCRSVWLFCFCVTVFVSVNMQHDGLQRGRVCHSTVSHSAAEYIKAILWNQHGCCLCMLSTWKVTHNVLNNKLQSLIMNIPAAASINILLLFSYWVTSVFLSSW